MCTNVYLELECDPWDGDDGARRAVILGQLHQKQAAGHHPADGHLQSPIETYMEKGRPV